VWCAWVGSENVEIGVSRTICCGGQRRTHFRSQAFLLWEHKRGFNILENCVCGRK